MNLDNAIESLLENASLTSDLDDDAADVLLAWGTACLERIFAAQAGLSPEQIDDQMRAVRRLMKSVNRWAPRCAGSDPASNLAGLEKIAQRAAPIYGASALPSRASLDIFIQRRQQEPVADLINNLRKLFE